ncbi:hypothetical protein NPIL_25891 [Nephila pilipes]|uniref:Uncharacterized protein n=1 Tax=Nephila pilipes TaxID=299642 RepID=A0A8X6NPS5_NEPPI|nr:hypothetical protein NPIL_25891 [Nephila pilipes]
MHSCYSLSVSRHFIVSQQLLFLNSLVTRGHRFKGLYTPGRPSARTETKKSPWTGPDRPEASGRPALHGSPTPRLRVHAQQLSYMIKF